MTSLTIVKSSRGEDTRLIMRAATLVSWLVTASLGAFMLRTWLARGGLRSERAKAGGLPPAECRLGAGDCMTVAGGGGVGAAAGAGAGAAGAGDAGAAGAGVSVVVAGLGCCALAQTIPLIESANAPANSDDMFIRFMCFLPGYFSAGRFADFALPKVPGERDNGPIRCQGEHMPSLT